MGSQVHTQKKVIQSAANVVTGAFAGKKNVAMSTHVPDDAAVLIRAVAAFHDCTVSEFISKLLNNEVRKAHDLTMMFKNGLEQGTDNSTDSAPKFSRLH